METIRLATFNLWWRLGDADRRQPAITSVLRRAQPDIVGLQEVWCRDGLHLAGQLAAELGFHTAWAAADDPSHWHGRGHDDYGIGNAILSRWPFDSVDTIPLPPGDEPNESRFAISAVVETPYGRQRVTNVHLNAGWWQNELRREQLRHLITWLADTEGEDLPMALVGDFNAGPDFDEMRPLTNRAAPYDPRLALVDSWECINPQDPGYTWDRSNPNRPSGEASYRIDYVFVGQDRADDVGRVRSSERLGTHPVEGVVASDHLGVVTEIQATPTLAPPR